MLLAGNFNFCILQDGFESAMPVRDSHNTKGRANGHEQDLNRNFPSQHKPESDLVREPGKSYSAAKLLSHSSSAKLLHYMSWQETYRSSSFLVYCSTVCNAYNSFSLTRHCYRNCGGDGLAEEYAVCDVR